ncbi:Rv3235 family protein [Mycobacterium sp. Lab-001]|uniref:Rv3235 family protein n=1 Tax=Mycobacterium sp. Lab-001 TaxID=3410136 RepID=UPI003D170EE9
MPVHPIVRPSGPRAFAVTPVVDYEPPTRDVPACRRSSAATLRRHGARVPLQRDDLPPGSGPQPPPSGGTVLTPRMRQAASFADAALRRVLEVIDRRRPAAQLTPMLAPGLVDSVLSVGRAGNDGAAVLRRMRLKPAGHRDPETAAEVFGSYSRGSRVHAIACRVEQLRTGSQTRWMVVALHIG